MLAAAAHVRDRSTVCRDRRHCYAARTDGRPRSRRPLACRWPALSYENLFDLLVLLVLFAAFVVGYVQGTVRRVFGIGANLFSLILAAQIRGPFGDFLIGNWTQFPPLYSRMLAFGFVFVVATVAFTIVIENVYERSPVLPRFPYADHILGGLLGIVEGLVIIGAVIMILDSYFRIAGPIPVPSEILILRDFDHAVDVSQVARIYRHDLIPDFLFFVGFFIPEELRALFQR
jgi:uncharacterized membrane protein required for colicin V production